ncbi:hypothetical protein NHX12_006734 [Muraenolepis orangiensis]|uniref:Fibronectin type-III domain-containing protein n=1 Tax=Muraenolepis orangiensis TaxID=630683 RepID=A0A9Q0DQ01_9TELE|nr:hypothetical protein NHX12_006734 [Muraenolepis orangiensis]
MDAVNTRYLLSWHWGADSVTMVTNTSVNFRAQRTYSDQAQNEDSYTDICVGVETHCDYSSHLKYSGQYALRVRAENRGQRSDWALQEFCPDEQAVLGAPSELRVEAGVSMVTVSFKEPTGNRGELMSSLLSPMHQEKEIGTTLTTLRSLHAHTRYCMEVQAFSKDFDKTSPYTPRLCTTTLGPTLVIQRGMVLRSVFPIPSSLLGLPPPTHVHVASPLLRWSAPSAHRTTTYTVQYHSVDTDRWQNVPSCVQSRNTSCDVGATMREAEFGCVRLHVRTHEQSLTSDPVEACSQQGDSCSPEVQLSSQPGTLTVHLSGDHQMVLDHGSQVQHLVYFAMEGEPLQAYGSSPSSVVIRELKEGQRYCVRVVFTYCSTPLGPPSCVKCQHIPHSVWSEGLPPPTHVHVASPLLRWSAPSTHPTTTYTVQYHSVDTVTERGQWQNVSSCVQSRNTSCDVGATMRGAEFGCVRLHVLAHEQSLTSDPVEACSQQGDSCSPEVQLSSQPGTLTVHLSGDHQMVLDHGSQVQHLVYFAMEGEPLQAKVSSPSSVVIRELKEGQRYCVRVVFTYFDTPLGPPSCVKCQHIPHSEERAKRTLVLFGVVSSVLLVLGFLLCLYCFLFQKRTIKKFIQPPYEIPPCISEPFAAQCQQVMGCSCEERFDHISLILPLEEEHRYGL